MPDRFFARGQRGGTVSISMNTDWEEDVIDQVVDYMRENMVNEVLGWMRSLVPVDTGELREKMWARARKLGKRVASLEAGSTADHFLFVEYGTGRRGKATRDVRGAGAFPEPAGYVHGPSRGNVAQPFARPAVLNVVSTHFKMGGGE